MAKVSTKKQDRSSESQSLAFKYRDEVVARQTAAFYDAFRVESSQKKASSKKASKRAVST